MRVSGCGYVAKCPAHPDTQPSLSISPGKDGRVLLHCHAGCTAEAITAAMGLKMADIMPESGEDRPRPAARPRMHEVAHYDYQDEDGTKLYRVTRFEPKTFRQAKFDGERLVNNMDGVRRVPYRLPAVMAAAKRGRAVFVVEGEKDVATVERFGGVATCNAGGAGKWDAAWSRYFVGCRKVYVVADNDPPTKNWPGQRHAVQVRDSLRAAGVDAVCFTMPDGAKDFTEWAERAKRTKRDLAAICTEPPPWPAEWEFNRKPETLREALGRMPFDVEMYTFAELPKPRPEEEDPDILVKGGWLERGGSAWIVSTAGTGKTIHAEQLALCFTEGLPFGGLTPQRKLRFWIFQSEDSRRRVGVDREDITAELSEVYPDVDWRKTWGKVCFFKFSGRVGAAFIEALDAMLEACPKNERPDVVLLNPFMAFIGGPVSDGSYVTPFLRGGMINHQETPGLQAVIERHGVGTLIYHHTPKPPTEKEIDGWLASPFPEYQGAGSSDITNWGRSFITMMRVKGRANMVCLTAGKNGAELGWDMIGGARRHYLAWSDGEGVMGHNRHAWRELTEEEFGEVTKDARAQKERDIETIMAALKAKPMSRGGVMEEVVRAGMGERNRFRPAWSAFTADPAKYGLASATVLVGRNNLTIYGLPGLVEKAAEDARANWINARLANGLKIDEIDEVARGGTRWQPPRGNDMDEVAKVVLPPLGGTPCHSVPDGGDTSPEIMNEVADVETLAELEGGMA